EKTYSKVRVWNGGTVSQETDLDGLTGPDNLPLDINGALATTTKPSPRANGLEQAPVNVAIKRLNAPDLPKDSPAYKYLYYRDAQGRLITGLIQPGYRDQYTSVVPFQGVYSNNPAGTAAGYLTTTNIARGQQISAYIDTIKEYGKNNNPMEISADGNKPSVKSVDKGVVAADNCTKCTIASPTASQPALFDAPGGRIGLQFATSALSATLPQFAPGTLSAVTSGGNVTRLGLNVYDTTARLNGDFNSGAWQSETFTTTIVTRGDALNSAPLLANK
ncbi:hypothetical protein, partial [Streptomyces sp. NPDC001774]